MFYCIFVFSLDLRRVNIAFDLVNQLQSSASYVVLFIFFLTTPGLSAKTLERIAILI